MTTKLDDIIDSIESELNSLILDGKIGAKKAWFGDIDDLIIEYPSVFFILQDAKMNDMQVIQSSNQIARDLNYNVYCLHSELKGNQKFTNGRKFANSVYDLLQNQHESSQRLNGECFDIWCDPVEYGIVTLEPMRDITVTGGVIRLVVQVIELF